MRMQVPAREFRVGDRLLMSFDRDDLTDPIVLVHERGFAWDEDMLFDFNELDPGPYWIERDRDTVIRDLVRVLS